MDKVQIFSQMATSSLVPTWMANLKVKVSTSGTMVVFILENSKMGSNMVKVNGKNRSMSRIAICMRVATKMIGKTVLGYSSGNQAITTKVTIRTMRGTAMAKCSGKMVAATRVSGGKASRMGLVGWSSQMAE